MEVGGKKVAPSFGPNRVKKNDPPMGSHGNLERGTKKWTLRGECEGGGTVPGTEQPPKLWVDLVRL